MANIDQMKDVLRKTLEAFSSADWKTYKAQLKENAVYEEEPTGRRAEGREAIIKLVEPWRRAFSDVQATIKEVIASGDALVVELEWSGTQDGPLVGPFGTIPPSGRKGKLPAVQVVRFDSGQIRELRHYFDLLSMLRQLGVAPQLGATVAGHP
jgi:steroid delta-isomerase-like uncharacterized protein